MSTRLREREERLQRVLERLIEESSRGTPVIVEGKKDVMTLRSLGVEGEIFSAKTGGKSQLDVICEVEERGLKEVILLLDFDRRGREWTKTLRQRFERSGIRPDINFWNQLLRFAGKEVKDVEGLATYMETLKKKTGEA